MHTRKHLINWLYWIGIIAPIIALISILISMSFYYLRAEYIRQATNSLKNLAELIRDHARQRFDLIELYQFQEQRYLNVQLNQIVETVSEMCRQTELTAMRRYIPAPVAQQLVLDTMAAIKMREIGYMYVLTSEGFILQHPKLPIEFDMNNYPFISEMLSKKEGSIRYWWKNPGESEPLERLAAFRTIYSWNWLIVAAIPIEDATDNSFVEQTMTGFYDHIKSMELPWEGQACILSTDFKVIAHPAYSGESWENVPGASEMINRHNGACAYHDSMGRVWRSGCASFDPWNWIIGVSAREDEILRQYYDIRNGIIIGACAVCLSIILTLRWIVRRLAIGVFHTARRHIAKSDS